MNKENLSGVANRIMPMQMKGVYNAQYLAPGVYIEEVPSTIKPIAGVGTSTAGFVGLCADRGVRSALSLMPRGGMSWQV